MNIDPAISPHLEWLAGVAEAGFMVGLHVRFTTASHLFQTYPEAWIEEYARDGLVMLDPAVAWAFEHQGRIGWDELALRDDAGIFRRAAAYGLRHGLTVSLLRNGTRSLGGFARSDRPFTAEEAQGIEAALLALHEASSPRVAHGDQDSR